MENFDFTLGYQIRLLALFCKDKDFFLRFAPLLTEACFSPGFPQWVYAFIVKYFRLYNSLPSGIVLEQEIKVDASLQLLPEEQSVFKELISFLEIGVPANEVGWIKESARKFASMKQMRLALIEHGPAVDDGDFDTVISALRNASQGLQKYTDVLKDEYVFSLRNLEEIYKQAGGIRTGINLIDYYVGGIIKKELTFILADTNVGKSLLMVYIGGQILRQKKKVLHVTLEMSMARTLIRYFATLAEGEDKVTYNEILGLIDVDYVFKYSLALRERYEGYLFVEELPTGKGTIEDMHRLVDKYQPDVLIVDYLDLMKPVIRREHKRFELGDLTVGLRGLLAETNIGGLSATQTSRQAHNRRIVGKQLAAEDYEKMRVADTVIGMGQSQEDALRHEVVFYLTKSRNTEKDKAERYFIDFQGMKFRFTRPELLGQQPED